LENRCLARATLHPRSLSPTRLHAGVFGRLAADSPPSTTYHRKFSGAKRKAELMIDACTIETPAVVSKYAEERNFFVDVSHDVRAMWPGPGFESHGTDGDLAFFLSIVDPSNLVVMMRSEN
jgi:hypothetical protein